MARPFFPRPLIRAFCGVAGCGEAVDASTAYHHMRSHGVDRAHWSLLSWPDGTPALLSPLELDDPVAGVS